MSGFTVQQQAADPFVSCWIEASAGSGKTKVLVDRLINLLLRGVQSDHIVCLTFTRAAAAEMAQRLNSRLRELTLMSEADRDQFINSLSFSCLKDPRQLFLEVLEAPPKIQTLHSFCQMLLLQFPLEAGISPHFRILEESEALLLKNQAIDKVFTVERPSLTYWGENRLRNMILQGLGNSEILAMLQNLFETHMTSLLSLPSFWEEPDAEKRAQNIFINEHACENIDAYCSLYLTQKGEIRKVHYKSQESLDIAHQVQTYREQFAALRLARKTREFLTLFRGVVQTYQSQKHNLQAFDFSDLITLSLNLLKQPSQAPWVLYRMANSIQHILIDEAQDTSQMQWELIQALVSDLVGEEGWTLFAVGDPKQSIYSFQGANPHSFIKLRTDFAEFTLQQGGEWKTHTLDLSFRSVPQILEGVDKYFQVYPQGLNFSEKTISHQAFRHMAKGKISFWPLIEAHPSESHQSWALPGNESLQVTPQWQAADHIAKAVESLITSDLILPSTGRPIAPKDILVLVRRRSPFVDYLVQGLKKRCIPVSGADRLVLTEHLAVQDLLAFGRFLLLPEDDFNLACLLKSSFIGCSEEVLWTLCHQRQESLWQRMQKDSGWLTIVRWLQIWREKIQTSTPYELYSEFLTTGGRAKILRRLGADADDVIDVFMTSILNYETRETPSLQGFLNFMQDTPPQFQRSSSVGDTLRVMTIHGAKGLEAPVVILIDSPDIETATVNPFLIFQDGGKAGFLLRPSQEQDCALTKKLKIKQAQLENEEQNRLLYVAMTRARDHLYISGWETQRGKALWYRSLRDILGGDIEEMVPPKRFSSHKRSPLPSWL